MPPGQPGLNPMDLDFSEVTIQAQQKTIVAWCKLNYVLN